jgi:hypothetical protein
MTSKQLWKRFRILQFQRNLLAAALITVSHVTRQQDEYTSYEFHVLLTVHNVMVLGKFFSMCLFQFSTRFEQPRAHRQENQLYQYNILYIPDAVLI